MAFPADKHLFLDALKTSKAMVYGCGLAGQWLAEKLGQKCIGFIDTDEKKSGHEYNGKIVFSPDQAKALLSADVSVVVSVVDIKDVINQVHALVGKNWQTITSFIDCDVLATLIRQKAGDGFLHYAIENALTLHRAYEDGRQLVVRSVDVVITEKCTLKCKDCANLMQYYEKPINIDTETVLGELANFLSVVDELYEVRLIGGEPFVNKNIYDIIKAICENDKVQRCVIYTNGGVPIKESKADILGHHKVIFSITDYGDLSRSIDKVETFLINNNIIYRRHDPEYWTESGTIRNFNRSLPEMEELFEKCCGKNLYTISNDRMYRCPFAANADRLFAIPFDEANSISLSSTKSEMSDYLNKKTFIPACNFCKGRSFDAPLIKPGIQAPSVMDYEKY